MGGRKRQLDEGDAPNPPQGLGAITISYCTDRPPSDGPDVPLPTSSDTEDQWNLPPLAVPVADDREMVEFEDAEVGEQVEAPRVLMLGEKRPSGYFDRPGRYDL